MLAISRRYFTFKFNALPSVSEVASGLVVLYRPGCRDSQQLLNILREQGVDQMVKLQDIDSQKPSTEQLLQVRHKLELPTNLWTEPELMEDERDTAGMFERWVSSQWDEYKMMTPIVYHSSLHRAVLCKPPERIQTLLRRENHDKETSEMHDAYDFNRCFDKGRDMTVGRQKTSNFVLDDTHVNKMRERPLDGRRWHERGGSYYDSDRDAHHGGDASQYGGGFDWSHVDFENYDSQDASAVKGYSVLDRHFQYTEWDDFDAEGSTVFDDTLSQDFKPGFTDYKQRMEAAKRVADRHEKDEKRRSWFKPKNW